MPAQEDPAMRHPAPTALRAIAIALVLVELVLPQPNTVALSTNARPLPVAAEPTVDDVRAPEATIVIEAATPELEAMTRAALEAMQGDGMTLPAVLIRLHDSAEPCRRPDGSARAGVTSISDAGYVVDSCGTVATLVHELAHVWEHATLDDDTRARFLELRGLESWTHDAWSKAGGEHFASIVAWGVTGVYPSRIGVDDLESLAVAYHLVTGTTAPSLRTEGLELREGRLRRAPVEAASTAGPSTESSPSRVPAAR